ncbi:TetR/AcrR family transcriptional regulator [Paenibacillaceae bacterium WGS1546]|uniref:TetR/AcrR family transcriptional regulator n=1 Tax=Cohnella sp. WGS1546 TaxID=3366810 RepID=UPI00372D303F
MDENIRYRIIQTAHQLFIQRGYRHVTVQDIAGELGMSKKTLYLYFASKEDIAQAVIDNTLQSISHHVEVATAAKANPLVVLGDTLLKIKEETMQLSPLFLGDIQKTVPHLWDYIVQVRSEKVKFVAELLNHAREQNLIRSSLNPQMVTVLFMETVQAVIRPDVWSKHGFTLDELWDTLFSVFFHGISNEEEKR